MLQQTSRRSEIAAEPDAEDEDVLSYQEIQREDNGDQQQNSGGERLATEAQLAPASQVDVENQVVSVIFIIIC